MTSWSDVVTTALLGTGRRPLPADLPPWADAAGLSKAGDAEGRLLDLAAAHRVAAQAGRMARFSTASEIGATAVPRQRLPFAPPSARRLLDAFLVRPEPATINLWLAACARQGCGLVPEHWARVVDLAARSTAYDRAGLGVVLGDRGRWFVHQNPAWQRLARALDEHAGAENVPFDQACPEPVEGFRAPDLPAPERVERDPELLLAVTEPWPDDLVTAAIVGLVNGRMGSKLRSYARRLGVGLTHAQYASLGMIAQRFLELPQLSPANRRDVRNLFMAIERAAYDRIEIGRAFDPSPERIFKITIPPV